MPKRRSVNRIRLMRVPANRQSQMPPMRLRIYVTDVDGVEYQVPTLTEAMYHLLSSRGSKLMLVGTATGRRPTGQTLHDTVQLYLSKTGRTLEAVPFAWPATDHPSARPELVDFTRDPPIEIGGHMHCKPIEVEVESGWEAQLEAMFLDPRRPLFRL